MATPRVCTVATRAQLARVRVLARSLRDREPEARLQALFVDAPDGDGGLEDFEFDCVRAIDIGIPEAELHLAAAHLSARELSLWLRPRLMLAMLDADDRHGVVFLGPASAVFGPLDVVEELLAEHPVLRVPFATPSGSAASATRHAEHPDDLRVWVPGFLAANGHARDWLAAVHARTRLGAHPLVVPGDSLRADWDALGIGEVDLGIVRHRGLGVGHRQIAKHKLTFRDGRFFVDGDALIVFDFDGFDPARPWALAPADDGSDAPVLADDLATKSLCRWYAGALVEAGFGSGAADAYRWAALPDGFAMNRRIRQAVRDAIVGEAEGLNVEPPPDPFRAETLPAFYRWLAAPERANERAPNIARLYYGIYEARPDLHAEYPELSLADAAAFRQWVGRVAHQEYRIPAAVSEAAFEGGAWPAIELPKWAPPDALRQGFLVTGYLRAELGIGDAARRALVAMRSAKITCSGFSFSLTKNRQHDESVVDNEIATDLDTNIVWVNADQLVYFSRFVGEEFFNGRYTVGCWAWETENPPEQMGGAARFMDEIWVPSTYSAEAIRTITDVPVFVFGHPVEVPKVDPSIDTRRLGMPEGFVFFFMFDFLSTTSRKNPIGLVEAFSKAFRPGEGPSLVLKSINARERVVETAGVKDAIGDRSDIVFIDTYVSSAEVTAMLARADCYVSLHRSEGFGLTLAESMALGVPVVATGYSGNLDFMDEDCAFLVPAGRSLVGRGSPPYPPDSIWGEPDLDAAAEQMRRVYASKKEASRRASLARKRVLREHGYKAAENFLRARMKDIQRRRQAGYVSTTTRLLHGGEAIPDWVGLVHQMLDYPDP